MGHRDLKDRVYPQFARIGQALASEKRLELIDLLAQAPRHVDALAVETGMSVANVSQHLQVLRAATLVEAERRGNMTVYRLSDPAVAGLWLALRGVAELRLAEVKEIGRSLPGRGETNTVSREEVSGLGRKALLLDVRPQSEFEYGHLRGAINIPIDELEERWRELPPDRHIVTYCRGEYCLMADEAAEFLRSRGFNVVRLEGGWPEWQAEGRPVAVGGVR
jgi:rhodanese-related sulfurtransferase/DNA-binding transcriptional ArsR family regulator